MARFVDKEGKVHVVDDDKVEEIKAELGLPNRLGKKVVLEQPQPIEKIDGEEVKLEKKRKKKKEEVEEDNNSQEETNEIKEED